MAEITLITGGSGSGKSAYGEQVLSKIPNAAQKVYLAAMKVYDEEGARKVERHKRLRQGKGFLTVEQPTDIGQAAKVIEENSAILLECMSNLAANEMFGEQTCSAGETVRKVMAGIACLQKKAGHLVIITNNVFEDGITYDAATMEYVKALAKINRQLSVMADTVTEVVVGIPVPVKGGEAGI